MRLIRTTALLRMSVSLVIYLGMMLAMRGTAHDRKLLPSIELKQSQTSAVIAKTIVSSRLRLIIVVGLEGTGHHYFRKVFKELFTSHDDVPKIGSCFIAHGIYLYRSMDGTVSTYRELRDEMRSGMKALAEREEGLRAPGAIVAVQNKMPGTETDCGTAGAMSFPNGHGPDKVLKYADIQQVAQLAEEEGVDLRIVDLLRPAESILVSSTVHRPFQTHLLGSHTEDKRSDEEKFMAYVQILIAGAGVMHSLLSELDPGFFICHNYNGVDNATQAQEIADFLAPNDVVAEYMKSSMLKIADRPHSGGAGLPFSDASVITERIQRKLDVIEEQICGAQAFGKR